MKTENAGYHRATALLLVRRIARPTRANLDYAAYHANFMNADPEPEARAAAGAGAPPDVKDPFAGALEQATLTGSLARTPLGPEERARPLALAPLVELLASKKVPGAEALEEVIARVRAERWGLGGGPEIVRQAAALLYLHEPGGGRPTELWVKVELAPWFKAWTDVPDADGDGFGDLYGRVPAAALGKDVGALLRFIREDYAGRTLSPSEVRAWANQLASYWYPSYNTDLVPTPSGRWPDDATEADVAAEAARALGGKALEAPTVVMRGKPLGKAVYNVFLVTGAGDAGTAAAAAGDSKPAAAAAAASKLSLARTTPTPDPTPVAAAVRAELAAHGGSWSRWQSEVAPLHAMFKQKLAAIPAGAKATAGEDGFLFFRQSLAYAVGGDLGRQRPGKNPIPVIVAWKKLLQAQGVDFLFVPVPTKVEVLSDKLASAPSRKLAPDQIVNPFERKLLLDLAEKGVEVVDLLPLFLRERQSAGDGAGSLLYQRQDTHWTARGLELAARAIAARVRRYPWYKDLARHRQSYRTQEAKLSRHGDLHSRLPDGEKARHQPEDIVGRQVLAPGGVLYEDDPQSPVVLLGDSFTGVFQLMDCEHAGVSAHLAKEIGYPVDLVMSYGGGPNVRQKLLRRGTAALREKKLVVWMMTARDLYDFWEGWQPLAAAPR